MAPSSWCLWLGPLPAAGPRAGGWARPVTLRATGRTGRSLQCAGRTGGAGGGVRPSASAELSPSLRGAFLETLESSGADLEVGRCRLEEEIPFAGSKNYSKTL